MTAPNLTNRATISLHEAHKVAGTALSKLVFNTHYAQATNCFIKVISLNVHNKTAYDQTFSVAIHRGGTDYYIAKDIPIQAKGTMTAVTRYAAIVLEDGDELRISAGAADAVEFAASFEYLTDQPVDYVDAIKEPPTFVYSFYVQSARNIYDPAASNKVFSYYVQSARQIYDASAANQKVFSFYVQSVRSVTWP